MTLCTCSNARAWRDTLIFRAVRNAPELARHATDCPHREKATGYLRRLNSGGVNSCRAAAINMYCGLT